jgi:hypothetical protein
LSSAPGKQGTISGMLLSSRQVSSIDAGTSKSFSIFIDIVFSNPGLSAPARDALLVY